MEQQLSNKVSTPPMRSYCMLCGEFHSLSGSVNPDSLNSLIKFFETNQSIDIFSSTPNNEQYGTAPLFGKARGKMFGVLEGLNLKGQRVLLYGFSGQFNGHWQVPGWAPPLFDLSTFYAIHDDVEKEIKNLTRTLASLDPHSDSFKTIRRKRKELSRSLMLQIHNLYTVKNFKGEVKKLHSFFEGSKGVPTGAGDCCGPKLLNYSIENNIIPTGIVEFYWGKTNKSGSKFHKHFYPSCQDKCQPLLGFMLCGLKEKQQTLQQR